MNKLKIGDKITIPTIDVGLGWSQDFRFYRNNNLAGIEFTVNHIQGGENCLVPTYELVADGYGVIGKYGNGAIIVSHNELEKGEKQMEKECEFEKEVNYRGYRIGLNKNKYHGYKWEFTLIDPNNISIDFNDTYYETDGDAIEAAIEDVNFYIEHVTEINIENANNNAEEEVGNNEVKIAAIKALRGEIYDLQEERKVMRGNANAINTIDANILCLADRIVAIANGDKNG